MKIKQAFYLAITFILTSSCGTFFNQPLTIQKPTYGENSANTVSLKNLPKPSEPIVVGVYKFRDQTGQYKESEVGGSFSTSVTQGATTILLKALEDSKWFTPIERENLGNLLNERNIIRSTRQEFSKNTDKPEEPLTPLLFAGVLLEGGIISYDSNILTGGFGARYFGAGGSSRYRQDRISVYLRLVSTSNGKILKTIYVSKTILSQAIDASLFRYVNFKRLLEVETGYTKNEPVTMAVTEAIEKAVEGLIIEGIKDNIWTTNAPAGKLIDLINNYESEKKIAEETVMFGRHLEENRGKIGLGIEAGANLINNDYPNPEARPSLRGNLKYFFNPYFNLNAQGNINTFANENKLEVGYAGINMNFEAILLPYDRLSPYIFAGSGYNFNKDFNNSYFNFQYGGGLEFMYDKNIGLRTFIEHNITKSDNIDYKIAGNQNDSYLTFGIGFNYYFKNKKNKKIKAPSTETIFKDYTNKK